MDIKRGRELLNKEQRNNFMKFPEKDNMIGSFYTFSKDDINIIKSHRRDENQLGFAVQLAVLRYPGWTYTSYENIPSNIVEYIAMQIKITPTALNHYGKRENTILEPCKRNT